MIHTQFAYLDPDISSGVQPPAVVAGGRSEWGGGTVSIHLQTNYPLGRLTLVYRMLTYNKRVAKLPGNDII